VVVAIPALQPPPQVLPDGSEQALRSAPLQVAVAQAGSPPVALVHVPWPACGAPSTAAHTPPPPSHASQVPAQAALQQTPSAQKPVVHCEAEAAVQAFPCAIMHAPLKPGRLHLAAPPQLALAQQTPSTHAPLWHCDAPVHASPLASFCTHVVPLHQ
jgi:hypothetical protein